MRLSALFTSRFRQQMAGLGAASVQACIQDRALDVVFQPIVSLRTGEVLGHEALVRGPRGGVLEQAPALQAAGQDQNCQRALELACVEAAVQRWISVYGRGKLFLNASAQFLTSPGTASAAEELLYTLRRYRTPPGRVVLEVGGYLTHPNPSALVRALKTIHDAGVITAMDDLRGTKSNQNAWQAIVPDMVKLDARLTHHLGLSEGRTKTVRALAAMATRRRTVLVAKGVESEGDLRALMLAGVDYAQGYFLGTPDHQPVDALNYRARRIIAQEARTFDCDVALP